MITKNKLEKYRENKRLIPLLQAELRECKSDTVADSVKDYRTGFPKTMVIRGVSRERYDHRKRRLEERKKAVAEVDAFIDEIDDDMTRIVFDLYYRKGLSFLQISIKLGMLGGEQEPRKRIRDKYLKSMGID